MISLAAASLTARLRACPRPLHVAAGQLLFGEPLQQFDVTRSLVTNQDSSATIQHQRRNVSIERGHTCRALRRNAGDHQRGLDLERALFDGMPEQLLGAGEAVGDGVAVDSQAQRRA